MLENRITITTKEAASILGISMPTMYELVHRQDFPSIKVGRKILINVEGLRKWIDNECKKNL